MDDHTQLGEHVLQPHSVLEIYHTAVCVGGKGDTSLDQLLLFWYTQGIDGNYVDGV